MITPSTRARRGRLRMSSSQRREQIQLVALQIFAQKGLLAATVEEIAASAQVSKPVVYGHFGNKEELFRIILEKEITKIRENITALAPKSGSGHNHLLALIQAFFKYIDANPHGFKVLQQPISEDFTDQNSKPYPPLTSILIGEKSKIGQLAAKELKRQKVIPALIKMRLFSLAGTIIASGNWWLEYQQIASDKKYGSLTREQVASHLADYLWAEISRP